jgi:glycosyltransferase involved in cell wall biosynthesis
LLKKLKIFYDVDGWAFHHNAKALQKYSPSDFEVSISILRSGQDGLPVLGDSPPDVILLYTYWAASKVRKVLITKGWPTSLVTVFNTGWPDKVEQFKAIEQACDLVFINNTDTWTRLGAQEKTVPSPNGVDLDIFKVVRPISNRRPKVAWVGSKLHRDLKGYDSLLLPVQEVLHKRGVNCELLLVDSANEGKRSHAEMAEWYNDATVYLCASQTEGTPNGALEAAACGCTLVSTRVGNMPELIRNGVNGYLVERTIDDLLSGIEAALADQPRLSEQMQNDIKSWSWERSAAAFYNSLSHFLCTDTSATNGNRFQSQTVSELVNAQ